MNAEINLNKILAQYSKFVNDSNDKNAVSRLQIMGKDGSYRVVKAADKSGGGKKADGRSQLANMRSRELFFMGIVKQFGGTEKIPELVLKALYEKDFRPEMRIDKEAHLKDAFEKGTPLESRHIEKVIKAVSDEYAMRDQAKSMVKNVLDILAQDRLDPNDAHKALYKLIDSALRQDREMARQSDPDMSALNAAKTDMKLKVDWCLYGNTLGVDVDKLKETVGGILNEMVDLFGSSQMGLGDRVQAFKNAFEELENKSKDGNDQQDQLNPDAKYKTDTERTVHDFAQNTKYELSEQGASKFVKDLLYVLAEADAGRLAEENGNRFRGVADWLKTAFALLEDKDAHRRIFDFLENDNVYIMGTYANSKWLKDSNDLVDHTQCALSWLRAELDKEDNAGVNGQKDDFQKWLDAVLKKVEAFGTKRIGTLLWEHGLTTPFDGTDLQAFDDIASCVYGSGFGEGKKGGAGYVGIMPDGSACKFLTKWTQRFGIGDDLNGHQVENVSKAAEKLREKLEELAGKVSPHAKKVVAEMLKRQPLPNGLDLLSRTDVAKAINFLAPYLVDKNGNKTKWNTLKAANGDPNKSYSSLRAVADRWSSQPVEAGEAVNNVKVETADANKTETKTKQDSGDYHTLEEFSGQELDDKETKTDPDDCHTHVDDELGDYLNYKRGLKERLPPNVKDDVAKIGDAVGTCTTLEDAFAAAINASGTIVAKDSLFELVRDVLNANQDAPIKERLEKVADKLYALKDNVDRFAAIDILLGVAYRFKDEIAKQEAVRTKPAGKNSHSSAADSAKPVAGTANEKSGRQRLKADDAGVAQLVGKVLRENYKIAGEDIQREQTPGTKYNCLFYSILKCLGEDDGDEAAQNLRDRVEMRALEDLGKTCEKAGVDIKDAFELALRNKASEDLGLPISSRYDLEDNQELLDYFAELTQSEGPVYATEDLLKYLPDMINREVVVVNAMNGGEYLWDGTRVFKPSNGDAKQDPIVIYYNGVDHFRAVTFKKGELVANQVGDDDRRDNVGEGSGNGDTTVASVHRESEPALSAGQPRALMTELPKSGEVRDGWTVKSGKPQAYRKEIEELVDRNFHDGGFDDIRDAYVKTLNLITGNLTGWGIASENGKKAYLAFVKAAKAVVDGKPGAREPMGERLLAALSAAKGLSKLEIDRIGCAVNKVLVIEQAMSYLNEKMDQARARVMGMEGLKKIENVSGQIKELFEDPKFIESGRTVWKAKGKRIMTPAGELDVDKGVVNGAVQVKGKVGANGKVAKLDGNGKVDLTRPELNLRAPEFIVKEGVSVDVVSQWLKDHPEDAGNVILQIFADCHSPMCGLLMGWKTQEEASQRSSYWPYLAPLFGFIEKQAEKDGKWHGKYEAKQCEDGFNAINTVFGYTFDVALQLDGELAQWKDSPQDIQFAMTAAPARVDDGHDSSIDISNVFSYAFLFSKFVGGTIPPEKKISPEESKGGYLLFRELEAAAKAFNADRAKQGKNKVRDLYQKAVDILAFTAKVDVFKSRTVAGAKAELKALFERIASGEIDPADATENYRETVKFAMRQWARMANGKVFFGGALGEGAFCNDSSVMRTATAEEFVKYGGKYVFVRYVSPTDAAKNKDSEEKLKFSKEAFERADMEIVRLLLKDGYTLPEIMRGFVNGNREPADVRERLGNAGLSNAAVEFLMARQVDASPLDSDALMQVLRGKGCTNEDIVTVVLNWTANKSEAIKALAKNGLASLAVSELSRSGEQSVATIEGMLKGAGLNDADVRSALTVKTGSKRFATAVVGRLKEAGIAYRDIVARLKQCGESNEVIVSALYANKYSDAEIFRCSNGDADMSMAIVNHLLESDSRFAAKLRNAKALSGADGIKSVAQVYDKIAAALVSAGLDKQDVIGMFLSAKEKTHVLAWSVAYGQKNVDMNNDAVVAELKGRKETAAAIAKGLFEFDSLQNGSGTWRKPGNVAQALRVAGFDDETIYKSLVALGDDKFVQSAIVLLLDGGVTLRQVCAYLKEAGKGEKWIVNAFGQIGLGKDAVRGLLLSEQAPESPAMAVEAMKAAKCSVTEIVFALLHFGFEQSAAVGALAELAKTDGQVAAELAKSLRKRGCDLDAIVASMADNGFGADAIFSGLASLLDVSAENVVRSALARQVGLSQIGVFLKKGGRLNEDVVNAMLKVGCGLNEVAKALGAPEQEDRTFPAVLIPKLLEMNQENDGRGETESSWKDVFEKLADAGFSWPERIRGLAHLGQNSLAKPLGYLQSYMIGASGKNADAKLLDDVDIAKYLREGGMAYDRILSVMPGNNNRNYLPGSIRKFAEIDQAFVPAAVKQFKRQYGDWDYHDILNLFTRGGGDADGIEPLNLVRAVVLSKDWELIASCARWMADKGNAEFVQALREAGYAEMEVARLTQPEFDRSFLTSISRVAYSIHEKGAGKGFLGAVEDRDGRVYVMKMLTSGYGDAKDRAKYAREHKDIAESSRALSDIIRRYAQATHDGVKVEKVKGLLADRPLLDRVTVYAIVNALSDGGEFDWTGVGDNPSATLKTDLNTVFSEYREFFFTSVLSDGASPVEVSPEKPADGKKDANRVTVSPGRFVQLPTAVRLEPGTAWAYSVESAEKNIMDMKFDAAWQDAYRAAVDAVFGADGGEESASMLKSVNLAAVDKINPAYGKSERKLNMSKLGNASLLVTSLRDELVAGIRESKRVPKTYAEKFVAMKDALTKAYDKLSQDRNSHDANGQSGIAGQGGRNEQPVSTMPSVDEMMTVTDEVKVEVEDEVKVNGEVKDAGGEEDEGLELAKELVHKFGREVKTSKALRNDYILTKLEDEKYVRECGAMDFGLVDLRNARVVEAERSIYKFKDVFSTEIGSVSKVAQGLAGQGLTFCTLVRGDTTYNGGMLLGGKIDELTDNRFTGFDSQEETVLRNLDPASTAHLLDKGYVKMRKTKFGVQLEYVKNCDRTRMLAPPEGIIMKGKFESVDNVKVEKTFDTTLLYGAMPPLNISENAEDIGGCVYYASKGAEMRFGKSVTEEERANAESFYAELLPQLRAKFRNPKNPRNPDVVLGRKIMKCALFLADEFNAFGNGEQRAEGIRKLIDLFAKDPTGGKVYKRANANYETVIADRIEIWVRNAAARGVEVFLGSDIGCGVFGNDSAVVGRFFGAAFAKSGGRMKFVYQQENSESQKLRREKFETGFKAGFEAALKMKKTKPQTGKNPVQGEK